MFEARIRIFALAILPMSILLSIPALAQSPFFTSGNLVVSVEGCGVEGGTCTSVPNGTGNGAGNSSVGGYGDNQGALFTLFQFTPNGTSSAAFVNSLVLPQAASGANYPVSAEYGSSSEGTLQLAGSGQYLTIMGYGINANTFNANPNAYSAAANSALAQTGSLTGQSYTPVARVVALIDPYGNVNSSTGLFNIFSGNNPRSTYSADGTHIYVSGQGTSGDATGGAFYTTLGSSSATTITGADAGSGASQDTRTVQIYNNTLFVSMDSKSGSYNRSYIGTLGSPPATSVFTCTGVGAGCPTGDGTIGPALMSGFGNTGGTGKLTITSGTNSNGNGLNTGLAINISPANYFFASPSVLYVADTGSPKNTSNGPNAICTSDGATTATTVGDGGLQKWINSQSNGTGTWSLAYTLYKGLNLVINTTCDPSNIDGTTGLLGLTGVVSGSNVYLYATNYTIADLDPSYLYGITDTLSYTTASQAASETFTQLAAAPSDSNFKGVSFAPSLPASSATITTSPSGLTVTTSGTGCAPGTYTTPITLSWTSGSSCQLSVASLQTAQAAQYSFSRWQDGTTGTTDTVTATSTPTVYSATFTQEPAGIYSPAPSGVLTGTSATFHWYGAANATAFWIDVGSSAGGNNYYSSGSLPIATLSATVNSLPTNGSPVYVTWYYLINGSWTPNSYSYTAFNPVADAATLTAPTGATLAGSTVTFAWTAGTGATGYWLDIGSSSGANNYYTSGNIGAQSKIVYGLPTNGSPVYVTLYSLVGGIWAPNSYTFTALNAAADAATLTAPSGSTLPGSTVTFSWTTGTNVSAYWLDIGSSQGGNNYYSSGNSLNGATTDTVYGLPTNNTPVYVTLYSLISGVWTPNSYSFTALNPSSAGAVLTTPTSGTILNGSTVTFGWSAGTGVSAYWLDIGSSAGGNNYYTSGNLGTAQTTTAYNLPTDGSTVYLTLYSLIGGQWFGNSYTFQTVNANLGLATMQSPTPGSVLSGTTVTFNWSSDTSASAYWVDVSTIHAGGNDLDSSDNLGLAQTETIYNLPATYPATTIYVTLYSYVGGQWLSTASTYTSGP